MKDRHSVERQGARDREMEGVGLYRISIILPLDDLAI